MSGEKRSHLFRDDSIAILRVANSGEVFLAIGLTLPNDCMPGVFRGCHPLVVGLHLLPSAPTEARP